MVVHTHPQFRCSEAGARGFSRIRGILGYREDPGIGREGERTCVLVSCKPHLSILHFKRIPIRTPIPGVWGCFSTQTPPQQHLCSSSSSWLQWHLPCSCLQSPPLTTPWCSSALASSHSCALVSYRDRKNSNSERHISGCLQRMPFMQK